VGFQINQEERIVAAKKFDVVIFNGRPASGKSEVLDYLKKCPLKERIKRFGIGEIDEIDDFPMLWTWFEEDAILEKKLGKPRLHTDREGYFLYQYQWHLLIERLSLEYQKRLRDTAGYHAQYTTLIEFSRGAKHGGYQAAYPHLSDEILKKAVIFYVDVSLEESRRKNRQRFNPDKPDSILEHGLPDDKLEKLYGAVDWEQFTTEDEHYVMVRDIPVPYVVLHNEPDITTARGPELGQALADLLSRLWQLHQAR